MTDRNGESILPQRPRLILDANVFISELIAKRRNGKSLVEACLEGQLELIYSDHLLDELEDVINRDKFRRWFTVDQGMQLIDAIILAGTQVSDRPSSEWPQVCEDPDDNYLFALYEDAQANLLVSDDKKVRAVNLSWFTVADRSAANSILEGEHPWGTYLIAGNAAEVWEKVDAAGHRNIFNATNMLITCIEGIMEGEYRKEVLEALVVPGTAASWMRDCNLISEMVNGRSFGTHPIVISPDLVGIKLVPDPGAVVVTLSAPTNLTDVLCLTLERCVDVLDKDGIDPLGFDGWRAHSIGDRPLQASKVRPPDDPYRKRAVKNLS